MTTTTEPYSEVSIANLAIDILDDTPITSLSDNRKVARYMLRNFGQVRDETLQRYPWAFATTRASLAADGTDPSFGWNKAYTFPADCLRMLPPRLYGEKNAPILKHEIEGRKILTDATAPLKVRYIQKVTNPTLFPPLFVRVISTRLAMLAAQNITGKGSYVQKAKEFYQEAWELATLSDTLESGTPDNQLGEDILNVRGKGLGAVANLTTSTIESGA